MSDRFSMLLWTFDGDGTCNGYHLVKNVSELGDFSECYPWQPIENSYWRTDKDGEVIGYYVVENISILEISHDFNAKGNVDCSTWDGAHRCEKKRWRRKGCCCIGWGRDEEKIPGTCTG